MTELKMVSVFNMTKNLIKRGCVALDTPSVLFRICILSYQMITNLGFDRFVDSKQSDLLG